MNIAADKSEVVVMIGSDPCNVSVFSESQIVCKLPISLPENAAKEHQDNIPYVKVSTCLFISSSLVKIDST